MRVELRQRPIKRPAKKKGMNKIVLYVYRGYSKEGDKIKHIQSEKTLDIEVYEKPKTEKEKQHNKDAWEMAEGIRAKTYLQLARGKYDIVDKSLAHGDFLQYADKKVEISRTGLSNIRNYKAAIFQLNEYTRVEKKNERLPFNSISTNFLEGFKKYLVVDAKSKYGDKKISANTSNAYFQKISSLLNNAVKDGFLEKNPMPEIRSIKGEEVKKDRLSTDELKQLEATSCEFSLIKRVFLFMCLTGLRFSDAKRLRYGDIQKGKEEYFIKLKQQKTDKIVEIPLHEKAIKIIGEFDKDNHFELIFDGLIYSGINNERLRTWVAKASIKGKNITWHSARHTFGQRLHDSGEDIATIADLMGDTIKTVIQNYVQISEKRKSKAVNKLSF